ncbi:hypothetical protein EHQ16_15040 [Leptospira kanakyensis]|uniref:Uncharacterized protein n=1 Tax=Leptospira kanakyensis TaxID=2484968 RepID=A0A6N4Q9Y5_9LEPT|nr:hypothetical protein [Leptospira kanakyensis]TGK53396.1 hypothetical protein EHQ11_03340 [Leptospira kanakyensis]TGK57192.1 hypothetical protein EHQ16_15040 [Leptospira kanakyensis]TGK72902.1 hypothetical protein EHQ18_03415 [Leptospira kanakyensis]
MRLFELIYKFIVEILLVSIFIFFLLIFFQYRGGDFGIFELANWRYVHLSDASENIKNAFFLAKGGKLNEYATSNHMPGLYLYLSLFFSVLPKTLLLNSLGNGIFIIVLSSFITIFTIVGLSFFSISLMLRDNQVSLFFKVCFCLILLHLLMSFDYFRVLSETYLPFFQLTYLSLFSYYLGNRKERFGYLVSAHYVIGLSIFFGLTNLFTDFIFFSFFFCFLVRDFRKIRIKHFVPAILLLIFILIKSGKLDFHYWIIETNKAQGLGSGLEMFKTVLGNAFFWPKNWYELNAFGPIYDHRVLVIILGFVAIMLNRKNPPLVLLLSLAIFVLPLDSWRIPEQGNIWISQSYKTDVNMGICFFYLLVIADKGKGLFVRILPIGLPKFNIKIEKVFFKFGFLVISILCVFQILSYLTNFIEFEKFVVLDHSTLLIEKNICKQKFNKQNTNCSCLSLMYWDQEFFLFNDAKPCPNQFSSYSPHLNSDDHYYNTVKSSFLDHNGAFLLKHSDLYSDKSIVSPRLIEVFRSGQCEEVSKDRLFLCRKIK